MAKYELKPTNKGQGDAFISFAAKALHWLTEHRIKLFVLLGLILLSVLGSQAYLYLQASQAKKIAQVYEKALEAEPEKALEAWKLILKTEPPLQLGDFIRLNMAGIYSDQGKWQEAAETFKTLESSPLDYVRHLAVWSRALSLENAKEYEKALKAYELLSQQSENPYSLYAHLGQARCLRQMETFPKAEKILLALLENPEAPLFIKSEATEQLMALKMLHDF